MAAFPLFAARSVERIEWDLREKGSSGNEGGKGEEVIGEGDV